jgi:hypothetical protein
MPQDVVALVRAAYEEMNRVLTEGGMSGHSFGIRTTPRS